jgi:hypothetical protein
MLRQEEIRCLAGRDVYDRHDDKIGTAGRTYVDADTGQPELLCVKTGLFGMSESFVPLRDAQVKGDALCVAFEKAQVNDAPNIDPAAEGVAPDQERQLYSYYGGGPS